MLTEEERQKFAADLYQAWKIGGRIEHVTTSRPDASEEDAYHIQLMTVERLLADGHRISGKKIGLTSKISGAPRFISTESIPMPAGSDEAGQAWKKTSKKSFSGAGNNRTAHRIALDGQN